MILYGIDPGYDRLGVSILEINSINGIEIKEIALITTPASKNIFWRIKRLKKQFDRFILKFSPDFIFMEELYWGRNVTNALKVGMAIGAIVGDLNRSVVIKTVHPMKIKKFITGSGRAQKTDIKNALKKILKIELDAIDDAIDSLAIAYFGASIILSDKNRV